ncbi:FtsB family cell division protein [Arcanobacterium ihumii]|uniref:FtsB family cell division protein n=1 Tax=Arcanobacterium ihumii TaxID=2138162 RepID=UPI000F5424F5|nr:septum formation initiator family protein [Arcanobacterium ihumii]
MSSRPPAPRRPRQSGSGDSSRANREGSPSRLRTPRQSEQTGQPVGKRNPNSVTDTKRSVHKSVNHQGQRGQRVGKQPREGELNRHPQTPQPERPRQATKQASQQISSKKRRFHKENKAAQQIDPTAKTKQNTTAEQQSAETKPRRRRDFGSEWNVVLSGSEKTRQFSLRLALIIATVMVGVFLVSTPLRGYIAQQEEKRELLATLEQNKERVQELEQQLALWNDPQFIQSQARQRLGFVLPGQTLYLVDKDALNGGESEQKEQLEELNKERRAATPFYVTMWDSISIAGKSGDAENPSNVPVINNGK